ncbi:MAG: undecaprenyl/decaprenyl-phosphate alpha-N-acetylglucosaminyl 1-phosphate transferase [Anaerolineae bacterium]|nr:undecaprenyl/decaprenyl-phosphate alpha-N-acetylglucosaminyl 1-phosphate transferase [Anaerolineae bacterium]
MEFVPILAVGFMTAYGFTPVTRRLALRLDMVDRPSKRKIHQEPIPLLGGVAIFGGFLLAMTLFTPAAHWREFGAVLAGCLWLALVGYLDDRNGMNPYLKLLAQVVAGLVLVAAGIQVRLFGFEPLNIALTLFWIVGITNALNLMDNMDGLAAGIAAIAAFTFFLLAASQELLLVGRLAAALCGATLGFLRYNFNPASTFMGDTGSLVIGFVLAVLGIKLDFQSQSQVVTWAIPLLVLGIPIFDTTLVTFTRLREGRSPFQGGKDHTSHRIASLGLSHRRTVVLLYGAASLLGAAALLISQSGSQMASLVIAAVGLGGLVAFILLEVQYTRQPS